MDVCFNPRAPLPGRASYEYSAASGGNYWFQSSRPVAGARIALATRVSCTPVAVSILAPRCRGAHRGAGGRMKNRLLFQSSRPVAGARIAALEAV